MVAPLVERYFAELAYVSARLPLRQVREVVQHIVAARAHGSTVFTLGNGGSAATASHFVCDLIKYGNSATDGVLRAHSSYRRHCCPDTMNNQAHCVNDAERSECQGQYLSFVQ